MGPYIYSDRPGHVLHGALAVAEIYEELNDLHEETVAIVLAQNKEVKRQLLVLKKEISDTCNNLANLCTRSHQSSFGVLTLMLFHVIFLFIILAILHWMFVHWHPSWYCHNEKSYSRNDIWPVLKTYYPLHSSSEIKPPYLEPGSCRKCQASQVWPLLHIGSGVCQALSQFHHVPHHLGRLWSGPRPALGAWDALTMGVLVLVVLPHPTYESFGSVSTVHHH